MTARFPALDRLTKDPLDPNKILEVAQYFSAVQEWGVAYHLLERASQIAHHPEILRQLGLVLLFLSAHAGDEAFIDASEQVLLRGLELDPESADLHRALAACAIQQDRIDDAEQLATMSLAAKPDQQDAQYTLALCAFYKGRWGEGFDLYEKNIDQPPYTRMLPKVPYAPYWDGTPGKKLLVIGEQGIGDEISLASMVEDAARDNEVALWCDPRLASLFQRSMPYAKVEGKRQVKAGGAEILDFSNPYDARCLSATLGRYYRRQASDFPRRGFLTASAEHRQAVREALDMLPGRKVGIAWTGGKAPSFWHRRGLTLENLRALTSISDVSWVSLQYDTPDRAVLDELGIARVAGYTEGAIDYDWTAALVMELDAVVSVPTAVAHLAGALGKRAHILVNEKPRWFYGREGPDHPWYASLTLYRQREGVWPIADVVEAVQRELEGPARSKENG